jgi:replicative DNA helicase
MPPRTAPAIAAADRVPPHSEEAERGVLGSALLDAGRVLDLCMSRGIGPDAFYVPAHRLLYEELLAMSGQQQPVDLLTVGQRLTDRGRLEDLGGTAFLERLLDGTPTAAHAEYYADLVHQKYLLRELIDRCRASIEDGYGAQDEAAEVLNRAEQAIFEIGTLRPAEHAPFDRLVKATMGEIEHLLQNPRDLTGISSGFRDLDKVLQGFQAGDMIVLAARPSMGKTALALNIAESVATGGNPVSGIGAGPPRCVAVFSLEMSRESLARRMLCSRARISWRDVTSGFAGRKDAHASLAEAADALMKARILIDDTPGMTAPELRSRARRLRRNDKIDLVVIDYLQLMNYPQYAREGRQQETRAISASIKAMAKELKVPVLVLSQLSRAPEQRERSAVPRLSDLRDSGSIEQDADVVLLLRRPCKYKDDPEAKDETLAIVDVAKHRNGPTGIVKMNFIDRWTRFEDRARAGGEPEEPDVAPTQGGLDE